MTAEKAGSEAQTADIFNAYEALLAQKGMTVADNCLRTWLFVRDVDTHYGGVVIGRRDHFNGIGLTPDTHFIASTGIAGFGDIAYCLVYLRDTADYLRVREVLQRSCPMLDPIYVLAPVCRPAWLVEMECMAVTGKGNSSYAAF